MLSSGDSYEAPSHHHFKRRKFNIYNLIYLAVCVLFTYLILNYVNVNIRFKIKTMTIIFQAKCSNRFAFAYFLKLNNYWKIP